MTIELLLAGISRESDEAARELETFNFHQQQINGLRTASLRLYHDQGGVPEYYSSKKYISLICTELECDSVSISINSYQGETKRVFAIR